MSEKAMEAARMMDMLPEADQNFACEFIKKLVLAWDPDFTKATPQEAKEMAEEYRDNIPENMQGSERYEQAESACDSLSEAVDSISAAIDSINEAMGE